MVLTLGVKIFWNDFFLTRGKATGASKARISKHSINKIKHYLNIKCP